MTSWPWPWSLTFFWKTLTLVITFLPEEIGISYCTYVYLVTRPITWYHKFDLVKLTLKFDQLLKNFNLGHNFLTRRDRAFKLHIWISCDKTFHIVPLFLTSRPWSWSLTYFWKTLTLAITFLPEKIGFAYCRYVFLVTIPFTWYHNFLPRDLDLAVWPTFEKL